MTEGHAGPSGEGKGDDRVGSILAGRYRILSRLGEGAMGAVYLGEHLKIGRRDALKVLRRSLARDEEAIARFTRGARNASGIRHRNVCAIYDFGTTEDGLHFLAMEYVDGGNLTDVLTRDGALPVPRAVSILLQAASALQVAHDRGIIHRDLKPDNIMLAQESDGRDLVKVVDFDISLGPPDGEGARVTRHGYVVGTPEYMSPEQLTGDPLKPTSDVYSLALVFFRMLTGRLPFDGGTAQEVMVNRLTVDPLALEEAAPELDLPHALEGVLRKALERRAEDRFQSAAAFAAAVREATGMPAEGGGGSWGGGAGRPQASGGAASGAASGAGAGAGTGVAAGGESIPRTRVSSSGDSQSAGFDSHTGGTAGTDPRRKMLWIGGGSALGLILLVGLGIALLPGSGDQTGDPLTDPSPPGMNAATPGEDSGGGGGDDPTGPGSDANDPPPTTDDPPVTTDPPDNQTTADPPPEDPVSNDPVVRDPTPTGDPEALPFPSGAPGFALPGGEPNEILVRLLGAGTGEPGGIPRPVLSAVRDTAWVVWSDARLSRPDSALAAYLIGSAMVPLGDSLPGIRWLEEAVRLDRLPGYVNALEQYRGGGEQ